MAGASRNSGDNTPTTTSPGFFGSQTVPSAGANAGPGPGGKGTSEAAGSTPPPMALSGQTPTMYGRAGDPEHPMLGAGPGGKGTSEAQGETSRPLPTVARNDWQGTLARGLAEHRAQTATPPKAVSYDDMVNQALLGKKWPEPWKAETKAAETPAAATPAPAAAPVATAEYNPEQPGVKPWGFNPSYLTGQLATVARGGAIHGYARGGVPQDDIVKLALALLRRNQ